MLANYHQDPAVNVLLLVLLIGIPVRILFGGRGGDD